MTAPQIPAPAAPDIPIPQPGRDQTPAEDAPSESSAPPAGTSDGERAAQRKQWARLKTAHGRGQRGGPYRRRAAGGTLPRGAGMIRRPPPDDAA